MGTHPVRGMIQNAGIAPAQ